MLNSGAYRCIQMMGGWYKHQPGRALIGDITIACTKPVILDC